jgi:homocitrate synthase NifV
MGHRVQEDIRCISALGLSSSLSVWCRARMDDLSAALRCDVNAVHISLPVSPIQLDALGYDQMWVLYQLKRFMPLACRNFKQVTVGALDATRADINFLHRFAAKAGALGASRIRLADTVGIGTPGTVTKLVRDLKQTVPFLPIEFHGHNDLGMATANAVTALEAGADAVSVTVNGLGERAGNSALEQVAMALEQHARLKTKIKTDKLLSLCRMVAHAADKPISATQPVVGEQAFVHESGIHCHALIKDSRTYEPFDPRAIGRSHRRFVLGAHSGAAAISHLLGKAGICISPSQARALKPLLLESVKGF